MCSVCMSSPCHPRCPNADEPSVVEYCFDCKKEIYEGEDYYDVEGTPWCEECMRRKKKTAELDRRATW